MANLAGKKSVVWREKREGRSSPLDPSACLWGITSLWSLPVSHQSAQRMHVSVKPAAGRVGKAKKEKERSFQKGRANDAAESPQPKTTHATSCLWGITSLWNSPASHQSAQRTHAGTFCCGLSVALRTFCCGLSVALRTFCCCGLSVVVDFLLLRTSCCCGLSVAETFFN
jgi:hypothetical protein